MSHESRATEADSCRKTLIMPVSHNSHGTRFRCASSLTGKEVFNRADVHLCDIKDLVLDSVTGRIGYAVVSLGGFLGMGGKLLAVPWNALILDPVRRRFVLNIERTRLEGAPGFDINHWPDMDDPSWVEGIHAYYGTRPYRFVAQSA